MDDLTLTPLPHPEVTRPRLARLLLELGWADSLEDGEHLAARLWPDVPAEVNLDDLSEAT